MADGILRSKHAFGNLSNLSSAIESGKIDSYDILFMTDENGDPIIGWLDKNGEVVLVEDEQQVVNVDSLPESGEDGKIYIFGEDAYIWNGSKFANLCKPTDVSELKSQVEELETEMEEKVNAETVQEMIERHVNSVIEVVEF